MGREAHTDVGDSEYFGGMTSYCSAAAKYSDEQGTLAEDFWSNVDYRTGQGVNGKPYVQRMFFFFLIPRYHLYILMSFLVTGCIRSETLDRINPTDDGGQYDSSGGKDGQGNPAGSVCSGYVDYAAKEVSDLFYLKV